MNTEERNRPEPNDLGKAVQRVGHRLEEHATTIVVAICGVLLIAAIAVWWSRQTSSSTIQAWTMLESAQDVVQFQDVADDSKFKGTPAARWAKLRESELYLQSGMALVFSDRDAALIDLKRANEGFDKLLADSTLDPLVRERAMWGQAVTLESICDGETTKAVEAYSHLLNSYPDSIYKPNAEQRIAELKTAGAKSFYAWFAKQNPKPTEPRPKDGSVKDEVDPFSKSSDIELPKLDGNKTDPASKSKDETSEKPADPAKPDDKPGDEPKPEAKDETKAGDKPESEKPADPKPADPKAESKTDKPEPKPDDKN